MIPIRCPECNHQLVLLQPRQKYKCALCSKLYTQKRIESETFRQWNQLQRKLDREALKPQKRPELTEEQKKLKIKEYRIKNYSKLKAKATEWRVVNRDDYNDQKRDYWNKKVDHLNDKRRARYSEKAAPEVLCYQKEWEHKNPYSYRLKRRLTQLREQQKLLALYYLKNKEHWPYTQEFQKVLPTFVLSDLL